LGGVKIRLLITGGSGLLGSKMAGMAVKKGHQVYSGYNTHQPLHGYPIKLDITDKDMVASAFEDSQPEVVVHAAAMTHVDGCEKYPYKASEVNIKGTENVATQSIKHNAYLIYVSTDYVFDGEKGDYHEDDKPNPINHYGETKLAGEAFVQDSGLPHCIVRPSVIYGASPAAGKVNFALWVINNISAGQRIDIITDQRISPTLNTNLAEMILEAGEKRLKGIYHLSGATQINRYNYTMELARVLGLDINLVNPVNVKDMDWLAERPKDSSLNVDKAKNVLRHTPMKLSTALMRLKTELEAIM
jgi:dTDP-4-dehydrorhamnose reductase